MRIMGHTETLKGANRFLESLVIECLVSVQISTVKPDIFDSIMLTLASSISLGPSSNLLMSDNKLCSKSSSDSI